MSCGRKIVQTTPRPVVITRNDRGRVIVRDPTRPVKISRADRGTVIRQVDRPIKVTQRVPRPVKIITAGPQGRPGAPGGSIAPIPFAYGDASAIRYTTDVPGTFTVIRIDYTTPFNGTSPQVSVGFVGSVDALMLAVENDPHEEAGFEVTTDLHVAGATGVWLEITPSGSTQGAGVLYLYFLPD